MHRLTITLFCLGTVGLCAAGADTLLADGGFESASAWDAYHTSVTASAGNAQQWWVGGDSTGWQRPGAFYPRSGSYCAGDPDGVGDSAGLVQFVPTGGTHTSVTVRFHYLLWAGTDVTRLTYGVFGWDEGDTIDLSPAGPGPDANVLVGPTELTEPGYYGTWPPGDHYTEQLETASFGQGQYDYVGVWFQYSLDGGGFYLDDATLTMTPEPTSLTLLGLGGLALLRRRNRKR